MGIIPCIPLEGRALILPDLTEFLGYFKSGYPLEPCKMKVCEGGQTKIIHG